LIFNDQTKNIVCEKEAPISYLFCIFDLTDEQVASRQLVFERNYEGESRGDSGRRKKAVETASTRASKLGLDVGKPVRAKRGLLELLKTGSYFASDYAEELVAKQVNLEEDRDELLGDEIKTISEVTDHVVKSSQQEFDVLELSLCLMKEEQFMSKMQAIMTQKITSMFQIVSKAIEDCSFGQVTTQVDSQHLHTLCVMYILTEKECNKILPVDIRQLFRCKNIKMDVEPTKLRLRLTAIIPGLAKNYKALHIYTIPVFVEDEVINRTRTLTLKNTKIFETQDGYLSFDECPKLGGITICDSREARSDDSFNCVKALINDHPAEAKSKCTIRT
jgi:hypothetical protein